MTTNFVSRREAIKITFASNDVLIPLGSISLTCLHVDLTRTDLKSAKRQPSHQSKKVGKLFFDCARVKVARKHVDEIDPRSKGLPGEYYFVI